MDSPTSLKRALVEAGFEVFRTRGDEVVLAERPRDNLIMDALVGVRARTPLEVRVTFRVQKSEYLHDTDEVLFERVRTLALAAVAFSEERCDVVQVHDPGDPNKVIDNFYDVTFVALARSFEHACELAQQALALDKRGTS